MRLIIKDNQVVPDTWELLPKDATLDQLTNTGDVIVPLAMWLEHFYALKARDGRLGVWLDADEEAERIVEDLDSFAVIALNFPVFSDGRNYSNARLLRDRYQYQGELRSIGDESEEHTSELQSRPHLVCRLLLEKKKNID